MPLVDWNSITKQQDSKVAYNMVLETFSGSYDIEFPKQNIKIKNKKTATILEIERSSKVSQKKTKIILKGPGKINKTSEEICKIYKTLLETLKKKSKKSYYLNLTEKYKNYIKKTKDVMKEIIGKSKFKIKKLPQRFAIDEKEKNFSKFFDTVNCKILIRKFEKYGIKHQDIDWFK